MARADAGRAAALTPAPWRREDGDALVLALRVQPGASRTEVAGTHGTEGDIRLKVRLAAPPIDGRANAELLRFLAEAFDVPLRQVSVLRGATSRSKSVRIESPSRRPDRGW